MHLLGLMLFTLAPGPAPLEDPSFGHLRHELQIDAQSSIYAAASGDLDGDGLPELVTENPMRIWQADDLGRFLEPPFVLSTLGRDPRLVDLDGDGDLDLLARPSSAPPLAPGYVLFYRNDGAGGFTDESASLPTGDYGQFTPRAGDLDGDGDEDLVVSMNLPRLRQLWINDGTGAFTDESWRLPTGARVYESRAVDMDGDGDLDLLTQTHGQTPSNYEVLLNDGSGLFAPGPRLAVGGLSLLHAVTDMDGDGDADVVLGPGKFGGRGTVRILSNEGDGTLVDRGTVGTLDGGWPRIFDADGDGLPEVLHPLDEGDAMGLYRNLGGLAFALDPAATPTFGRSAYELDTDRDGDLDLIVGNVGLALWRNDGGAFTDVAPSPETPRLGHGLAVGDIDGDGDVDGIVYASGPPGPAGSEGVVYWNDGTGRFETTTLAGADELFFRLFDADGDGDLDVLHHGYGSVSSSGIQLFENLGDRTFVEVTQRLPPVPAPGEPLPVDADGDGDQDLFLMRIGYPTLLALNDGSGVFELAEERVPPRSRQASAYAAGDVDGDGDQDVVVLGGNEDWLLRNAGDGVFSEESISVPWNHGDAFLADMDGDGDLDLVGATGRAYVYTNDGMGAFTLDPDSWAQPVASIFVPADLDGDGDPDLVSSSNELLLQEADGTWREASQLLPPILGSSSAHRVGASDFDGDGDVDLWMGRGRNQIHVNLRTQLSRASTAAVGKPLELELRAEPLRPWVLFASAGTSAGPRPVGGVTGGLAGGAPAGGTAWLLVGSGVTDATGFATRRFDVPLDARLIGRELVFQARVGQPPRLTNRERVRLTGL